MKKFLFVSLGGLGADLAWQVQREGNEVKLFINDQTQKDIGLGFVPKTENWEAEADWADVIVFDDVLGQGKQAAKLRQRGKPVIGGTPYTDRLEDDRSFGQDELKSCGVNIIPYQNFTSYEKAIDFVRANPGRYVLKPVDQTQNVPKGLLFVGEEDGGQDVIQILEAYRKIWSQKIKVVQLQKRIVGVEMAVGGFFNGYEFIHPININFEHKKLFPGNIGPMTGEMGTAMFWSMPNRIFNSTLKKLENKLREEKFVGYIDLNCIVNGSGIYPLEFTSRFGYPTIFIQKEGLLTPISEFFFKLAGGEKFSPKYRRGFQVGVRIIVPPYPYDDPKTFEAYSKDAIITFRKPNYDGVHFEDAKMINDVWLVAGNMGAVMTVVGTGSTMKQAQQQAYQRVKNILIPNMYYRTDIGDRWFEDADRLHNWGYLREL